MTQEFSVRAVCRTLDVGVSGFYAWRSRQTSRREQRDQELSPIIGEIFWRHKRRYGARRIAQELQRRDIACGVGRVARLMKTLQLQAIQPKSFQPKTTHSDHRLGYNPNLLVDREPPQRINEVWVADITYVPLRSRRFGYLALLMDLSSRKIVGWEYGSLMDEQLVLSALSRGIRARQPEAGADSPFGPWRTIRLKEIPSHAPPRGNAAEHERGGNCYDNAFMESCFGTIKTELQLVDYRDDTEAVHELTEYVRYYNFERRHSSLGYDTPLEFELKQPSESITPTVPK